MPPPPRITVRLSGRLQAKPAAGVKRSQACCSWPRPPAPKMGARYCGLVRSWLSALLSNDGQAIVEGEARVELPGVLPVKVEEAVVIGLGALEGRGLIDVADAEDEALQGEA